MGGQLTPKPSGRESRRPPPQPNFQLKKEKRKRKRDAASRLDPAQPPAISLFLFFFPKIGWGGEPAGREAEESKSPCLPSQNLFLALATLPPLFLALAAQSAKVGGEGEKILGITARQVLDDLFSAVAASSGIAGLLYHRRRRVVQVAVGGQKMP